MRRPGRHKVKLTLGLLLALAALTLLLAGALGIGWRLHWAYVATSGNGYRLSGRPGWMEIGMSRRTWRPAAGQFYTLADPEPPPPGTVSISEGAGVSDTWSGNRIAQREHLFDVIPYPSFEDYSPTTAAQRMRESAVVVPYWQLAGVLLVAPAAALAVGGIRSWRGRVREKGRRCVKCGYDLRASPERCPECGTPQSLSE